MAFIEPVTLRGELATLVPLEPEHETALARAAADGELWRLWYTHIAPPDKMREYVATALDMWTRLGAMPFVVRENATGEIVGCTRYFNVDATNRRLEIGHTWYSASARRTGVNTETKLVMLSHAFDDLGCVAVEFRTHFFNQASRAAIERLGAKLDGILRSHQLLPDGSRRDTAVYSILDIEWPAVRTNLRFRLSRHSD